MESSHRLTQEEQRKQLLGLVDKIRQGCPEDKKEDVLPLLDRLVEDQKKLDQVLQQMLENKLVGETMEEIKTREANNQELYEQHTAIADKMKQTLEKVLSYVQKK